MTAGAEGAAADLVAMGADIITGLSPGDFIVARHDGTLTSEEAEKLRATLARALPDFVRVVVIDRGVDIEAYTSRQVSSSADLDPQGAPLLPRLPGRYFVDIDGQPWAVVFEGDGWQPEDITPAMVLDIIAEADQDAAKDYGGEDQDLSAGVYYLTDIRPEERDARGRKRSHKDRDDDDDLGDDFALYFCAADDPGAYRVVAVRLT